MKLLLIMLIFCLTLFFYLHLTFHTKISNDLEVYEIEKPTKDKFEEVCDFRQPLSMKFEDDELLSMCQIDNMLEKYYSFDVNIREVGNSDDNQSDIYLPLRLKNALKVINDDKESKYIIEANGSFLQDTGIHKVYRQCDEFLRPYMISSSNYDLLMGSSGSQTPFRYDINYRKFFNVLSGSVKIKLAPPKYSNYLHSVKDYHNFEFRSPINPWNVKSKYVNDFAKVKCLEVNVNKGEIVYIPAFWWYSIEYGVDTVVASFKYDTYFSLLSMAQHYLIKFLQSQNVTKHPIALNEVVTSVESDKIDVSGNIASA